MKAWAVMRRDLRKYQRNPITMITSILMPIVYLLILGNAFNGVLKRLPLAVVREDQGMYGRRLAEELQALSVGPKTFTLTYLSNSQSAITGVRDGKYRGALIIPADFSH